VHVCTFNEYACVDGQAFMSVALRTGGRPWW
jgi:hypothetical protein